MPTRIVAVGTVRGSAGSYHDHITAIKTDDGRTLGRAAVVELIRARREDFCTVAGDHEAGVIIAPCPYCALPDHLQSTIDVEPGGDPLLNLSRLAD